MNELTLHVLLSTDTTLKLEREEICLVPLLGNGSGGMKVLTRAETVIGRQSGVDILVRDPKVSRRHCKITIADSGPRIVDLESRNGTFVNEIQVAESPLQDGDLIQVGSSVFRLRYVDRLEVQRQEELYRKATRDGLTGLHTRQYLMERLNEELPRARRHSAPLSFLLVDLDDFKQVNDRLGHPAGDQALRAIAEVLARKLRTEDIAARVGGEEFGILAPQTDRDGAQILGEQLRQLAEDNEWSRGVGQMALTVSIGTATFPNDADAACDLIQKADVALYRAKRSGRNRVVSYAPNCDETEK